MVARYINVARAQPQRCQSLSVANPVSAPLQLAQAPGFCQLFPPFLPPPKPRSFPDHGSTTPRAHIQAFPPHLRRSPLTTYVTFFDPSRVGAFSHLAILQPAVETQVAETPQPRTRKHLASYPPPPFFSRVATSPSGAPFSDKQSILHKNRRFSRKRIRSLPRY